MEFKRLYDTDINYKPFDYLKDTLLFKRIVEWDNNSFTLDNGVIVTFNMTESDCCAYAMVDMKDIKLDAVITDVKVTDYKETDDEFEGVENSCTITIFHNRNEVSTIEATAGHNGYYYSVGAFKINDVYVPIIES